MKLRTAPFALALLSAFLALPIMGCSALGPKREAAVKDISAEQIKCASSMLGHPMKEIAAKCGATLVRDALKNFEDLVFGMKEGAAQLGANIPDAPTPGTYLKPDAGAQ